MNADFRRSKSTARAQPCPAVTFTPSLYRQLAPSESREVDWLGSATRRIALRSRPDASLRQSEEPRPRPAGSGDLACDLRQRSIPLSLKLESVVENGDRMGSAAPFPDQTRARSQTGMSRPRRLLVGSGLLGCGCGPGETLPGPFRQPAELEFLKAVRHRSQQQITTDARRLRVAESSPLLTHCRAVEILQSVEPGLQRRGVRDRSVLERRCAVHRRSIHGCHCAPPLAPAAMR